VAYVEGGELTVLESDGSKRILAETAVSHSARTIAWSPDGRWLLYMTEHLQNQPGTYHIWESETGETLHLGGDVAGYPPEVETFSDHRWSPKGARILFEAPSDQPPPGIWVLDLNARRMWQISDQPVVNAAWVDDRQVLYAPRGEGEPLPSRLVNIGPPSQPHTGTVALNGPWSLSPDRHYAAGLDDHGAGNQRLRVIPLPGQAPLTVSSQPTGTVAVSPPLWSPDGRWIAYGAKAIESSPASQTHTVVIDTKGVGGTRIIDDFTPQTWSPDSRLLTGPSCSDAGCGLAVAAVSSDLPGMLTGTVRSLIDQGTEVHLWSLAWSPGGAYLAYSLTGSGVDTEGVMLWDRTTGEHHVLLSRDEAHPLTDLQWTPDGCRLYVAQRRSGDQEAIPVESILALGPAWEDRWAIASSASRTGDASAEASEVAQDDRPQPCPISPLIGRRLIAYYGTPLGPGLGVLGRNGLTTTLKLLEEQAQVYRDLDPNVETLPVFHMVTTIADDYAGPDGDYNHRVSHETIRPWIEGVEAAGGWAVLDVQPGRAELDDEIDLIEDLLMEPNVHLAVDPEFIVNAEEVPGEDLGRITGPQVNRVQARMERIGRATGRHKMLVIHQFDDRMIEQKDVILDYPFVELVWDADGFGTPGSKIADYEQYRVEAGFEHGGFKLFYNYDDPLMTAEEVLGLEPPPALVIYQ
jgi:WD40 repeat protein